VLKIPSITELMANVRKSETTTTMPGMTTAITNNGSHQQQSQSNGSNNANASNLAHIIKMKQNNDIATTGNGIGAAGYYQDSNSGAGAGGARPNHSYSAETSPRLPPQNQQQMFNFGHAHQQQHANNNTHHLRSSGLPVYENGMSKYGSPNQQQQQFIHQQTYNGNSNNLNSSQQLSQSYSQASSSSAPYRRTRENLPKSTTNSLKSWLLTHAQNPYPTEAEKKQMCDEFQLSIVQLNNWFINGRRRYLKRTIDDQSNGAGVIRNKFSPSTSLNSSLNSSMGRSAFAALNLKNGGNYNNEAMPPQLSHHNYTSHSNYQQQQQQSQQQQQVTQSTLSTAAQLLKMGLPTPQVAGVGANSPAPPTSTKNISGMAVDSESSSLEQSWSSMPSLHDPPDTDQSHGSNQQ
jgi:hypothetical protein